MLSEQELIQFPELIYLLFLNPSNSTNKAFNVLSFSLEYLSLEYLSPPPMIFFYQLHQFYHLDAQTGLNKAPILAKV